MTLFASGELRSSANLVPCVPMALRLDPNVRDPIPYYMLMLGRVRELADEFDILHFHVDQFHFPLFRPIANRTVTTLHGRHDLPDLKPLYLGFRDMPLVSISNDQRRAGRRQQLGRQRSITASRQSAHAQYATARRLVAFLGRISPEKRPDRAIQIAQALESRSRSPPRSTRSTRIICETIEPLLDPGVNIVGEIGERQKGEFLGAALALLFPVDWPEPFGLSMIEAMACGTPVLAFRWGSVAEIIDPGIPVWSSTRWRRRCARCRGCWRSIGGRFGGDSKNRFSATRMAKDYVQVYRSLLNVRRCQRVRQRRERHCPAEPSTARACSRSWKKV